MYRFEIGSYANFQEPRNVLGRTCEILLMRAFGFLREEKQNIAFFGDGLHCVLSIPDVLYLKGLYCAMAEQ